MVGDNRLIELGLKPAKPNILASIFYKLFYRKEDKCICGRPFSKVWKVNVSVFNGYVYDPHQGLGEEWIWHVICINCYKKNRSILRELEEEGMVKVGKEAYKRINGELFWKPLCKVCLD